APRAMSRLPIRVRVAAGFAVAMAVVLAGTGVFIYAHLSDDLAAALDQQLQLRAQDLSEVARDPRGSLSAERTVHYIESGESFAQLLSPDGRALDATTALHARPLLDAHQRARALAAPLYASLASLPNLDEGVRLLATPIQRAGRRLILVVGATAENRRETLASLRDALLIVGPVARMRAELDYALHYAVSEDELRAALRTASDETDRLVALAGALLLMASSDRGRLHLRLETVAVDDLLTSVQQRFAWRAEQLGRTLVTERGEAGLT